MVDLLLDTNILIYILSRNQKYLAFLKEDIEMFEIIPLNQSMGELCAKTLRSRKKNSLRNPKTADIMIASTALDIGVPLVTINPRDFKRVKGLKIAQPKYYA
ncbi:MAG: type II toxin-antitoxin system VapC family toxin [Candidatus Dojkabacteria bacterium]